MNDNPAALSSNDVKGLPHWDAAVRVAVIHASGPVVFEGTAL